MPPDELSGRSKPSTALTRWRDFSVWGVLLLLLIVFGSATRNHAFLSAGNLVDLLRQSSILAVAAMGMTLLVLTGGIDLSVGSLMALVGVGLALGGRADESGAAGWSPWLLVPLGGAAGFVWGGLTATCITRLQIPPLITTLGTLSIGRGLVQWITGGESIRNLHASANWERLLTAGRGSLGPLPTPVVVAAAVVAAVAFLLRRTIFGIHLYGLGCNEEACRLAGIDVRRVKLLAYGLAGSIFALAGLMHLGRTGYAQPDAARGFELDVVTAVVLGGVSITGGEGRVNGVLAGVLILGALDNGLTMLNLQNYQILVVKGAVLLLAVTADRLLARRAD